jgi:serine/threonine-protein kinase
VDPRLAAIVHKALEKDPNARFQSAREMKQAIEEVVGAPDLRSDDSAWQSAAAHVEPELAPTFISPHASAPLESAEKKPRLMLWAAGVCLIVAFGLASAVVLRQPAPTVEALPRAAPTTEVDEPVPSAVPEPPVKDEVAEDPEPEPVPEAVSRKRSKKRKKPRKAKKRNSERGHDRNTLEDPF